jgi:glutamate-1-semialdehyde 2,1-aminomutase
MNISQSQALMMRAKKHIPGGVNSPVRAFNAVGGDPRFIARGYGCQVEDVDGNAYIDFVGSWGPLIVGHAHPEVLSAIQVAAERGLSFGAPTALEVEYAEFLKSMVPSLERLRLVSSGTEATMSAIRLARGFTGRDGLVKFVGCYHGHSDSLLVQAGSGVLTFGKPGSAGVPQDMVKHTLTMPYNDCAGLRECFALQGNNIAAIIVEPIAGNMGMVMPSPEFLQTMRDLCDQYGALLIVDEVMTGFRVHSAGAVGLFNLRADLITLGKVIGGGMPVAAFGGRAEVMNRLSPLGDVYQAGTLSGNPVALAAGMATLRLTRAPGFYETITERAKQLVDGLTHEAKRAGISFCAQSVGGMFGIYFADALPNNLAEVQKSDTSAFNNFFHAMLNAGHYFAPSAFEAGFVSIAHRLEDINTTIDAARQYFSQRCS